MLPQIKSRNNSSQTIRNFARYAVSLALLLTGLSATLERSYAITPTSSSWSTASANVSITGTSTLHDWEMKGTELKGNVTLSTPPLTVQDLAKIPEKNNISLNLSIPCKSLKSGEEGMDDKAYEALKAEENPEISFSLATLKFVTDPAATTSAKYQADGEVKIAGSSRSIKLDVDVAPSGSGELKITTKTKLLMTDFKMEPPSAMLGMITSGDEVGVAIEWTIAQINK